MDPRATAGRIVHFYPPTGTTASGPIAAIVNRATHEDGEAELTVFMPDGPTTVGFVPYTEEPTPGYWSWMPYQKAESAEPQLIDSDHLVVIEKEQQPMSDRLVALEDVAYTPKAPKKEDS